MTITYEYDNIGNVERVLKNGTPIYSCEIDADMQLIHEQDYMADSETQYFYTASGELYLTRKTLGDNVILSYTLTDDETGKSDYITEINGTKLTYSSVYDEENDISKYILPNLEEITSDTDDFGRTTTVYLKDADGNTLLSCTYAYVDKTIDGTVHTSEYTASMTYSNGDRYEYTYDANGNITRYKEGSVVMEYHYDELGQLIREDNGYAQKSWTYTYDNAGNILTKSEYPYSTGALGGRLNRIDYTYSNGNWGDQLTSYRGETFTYDSLGNPVVWRDNEATWEGRNLVSYMDYDFTYDANGLRTTKDNISYIYDENNNLVKQIWDYGDGDIEYVNFYYDESGSPVGFDYMGDVYYYVKNQQGDILKIVDPDGEVIAGYRYDAWGKVLSTCGDDVIATYVNPLLYRGYYYDWETELYYLQSRYYDPAVGRFLNADAVDYLGASGTVIGYNLYAYCENNAVDRVDPCGYEYSPHRALNYARKWWNSYSPNYAFYKSDCTNFVSQCLYAGGLSMDKDWNVKSRICIRVPNWGIPLYKSVCIYMKATRAWTSVVDLFDYLSNKFTYMKISNRTELHKAIRNRSIWSGQVVFFQRADNGKISHVGLVGMVCPANNRKYSNVYFFGHTNPRNGDACEYGLGDALTNGYYSAVYVFNIN